MALDNLPAFPDDMYDTAHDGAVPQPVTPRKPISPFSFTKHLTRTPVPVAVVPEDLPDADLPITQIRRALYHAPNCRGFHSGVLAHGCRND